MQFIAFALAVLLGGALGLSADVYYVEEIVNSGGGDKKGEGQKTTKKVYIKGNRQKVDSQIEADKELRKILEKQGRSIDTSVILDLDQVQLYKVDNVTQVYQQDDLPAPLPAGVAAKPVSSEDESGNKPKISFRVKELADTKKIEGILCQRIAAEMKTRYYQPGTTNIKRENRYLYQAWMAKDFPGYEEILTFQKQQAQKTSYPSIIGSGLEQLMGGDDDSDELAEKVEALEGFPMESVLKVSVSTDGKTSQEIFKVSRSVKSISSDELNNTVFDVSETLTKIKP